MANSDLVEDWKQLARRRMLRADPAPGQRHRFPYVHLTYGFAFMAIMIGLRYGVVGPFLMTVLLPCVLFAQELPRALLARALGRSAEIRISALGGWTEISGAPLSRDEAFAIGIVGSIANLTAAAAGIALLHSGTPRAWMALAGLWSWSHAAWGLGQVVPLLPFRAGQALASRLPPGSRVTHAVLSSVVFLAIALLVPASPVLPALFPAAALAAFAACAETGRALAESSDARSGAVSLAARAVARLRAGDPTAASALAERALPLARCARLRAEIDETLAWAAIGRCEPVQAHLALARVPPAAIDYYLVAAYLSCCNRIDEAVQLLHEARNHGRREADSTKLLIDLLYRQGDTQAALALARADAELLSAVERQTISTALLGSRS